MPAYRRSRLGLILFAVVAAAIAVTLALTVSRPAAARATTVQAVTSRGGAKPTIVLVHGAWADGGSWSAVAMRLQRLGYTVDIPPNPLRGLPQDSAYLRDFLSSISGPIVLAGHSYGGDSPGRPRHHLTAKPVAGRVAVIAAPGQRISFGRHGGRN